MAFVYSISSRLSADDFEALTKYAQMEGVNISRLIRDILKEALDHVRLA